MEEILYLESDEEITLIIEKIKNLPGNSVALVLPAGAQLLRSIINLELLKREADRLSKKVSIITQDKSGAHLAQQVGIAVYDSINAKQPLASMTTSPPVAEAIVELENGSDQLFKVHHYDEKPTHQSDLAPAQSDKSVKSVATVRQPPKFSQNRLKLGGRLTLFLIGILAFLTAVGWWLIAIFPTAQIILELESEPVHETVTIIIDNNIDKIDVKQGRIPGQKLSVNREVKLNLNATGEKDVGTPASGNIIVKNRLGQAVKLAQGIKFKTSNLVFSSTEEKIVPAATASVDDQGNAIINPGTVVVPVQADSPGEEYNIGPANFVILSFTGIKQDKVTGESTEAMTGGESKTVKIVTQADLDQAPEIIKKQFLAELEKALEDQAEELVVLEGSTEVAVGSISSSKKVDEEADQFEVTAQVKATTIAFHSRDYQQLVFDLVSQTLPEGKSLAPSREDSLETSIKSQSHDQGIITVEATLKTRQVVSINQQELKNFIAGKTTHQVQTFLQSQDGFKDVRIILTPNYKKYLPSDPGKIKLVVN